MTGYFATLPQPQPIHLAHKHAHYRPHSPLPSKQNSPFLAPMSPSPEFHSNKENTPTLDLSRPSKPRMVGMGRPKAPSASRFHLPAIKKRGASIAKSKLKASMKRRISVRRKLRSKSGKMNRMTSGREDIQEEGMKEMSGSVTPKSINVATPVQTTLSLAVEDSTHDGLPTYSLVSQPRLGDEVVCQRVVLPAVGYPFRLMRDPIPPVTSTTTDGVTVPIEYMMRHLTGHLPLIWQTRWQYVAAPEWYHTHLRPARLPPQLHPSQGVRIHRIDDIFDEIPIYVKAAPQYGGLNVETQQKFGMRAPTVCLAVRQAGRPDQPAYLYPINEAVLTSRCAYYDQLVQHGKQMQRGTPIATQRESEESEAEAFEQRIDLQLAGHFCTPPSFPLGLQMSRASSCPLPLGRTSITIDELVKDTSLGQSSSSSNENAASRSSKLFNSSIKSDHLECKNSEIRSLIGYRKVPLIPIYVPHYASVHCLLHILHHPNQPFVHLLLSVEPLEAFTERNALEITSNLPRQSIIQLMSNLQGLISNVNAFGISNEFIWSQLHLAHRILIEAMRRRGGWIRPDMNYMYFPNVADSAKEDEFEVVQVRRGAKCPPGYFWFPTHVLEKEVDAEDAVAKGRQKQYPLETMKEEPE